MTQHTEGEWKAHKIDQKTFASGAQTCRYSITCDESETHIAETIGESQGDDESEANARLIAAAPKLLLSAQLEMLFPFQTEEQRDRGWSFARSMGWKEDRPIAHFADEYRKDAIAAAKGNA